MPALFIDMVELPDGFGFTATSDTAFKSMGANPVEALNRLMDEFAATNRQQDILLVTVPGRPKYVEIGWDARPQ